MDPVTYQTYLTILKKELIPAMGCTEPIAIAFCAAKARAVLNKLPEKVLIEASGNIIKNVKSVVVPNTKGMRGMEVAAVMGIIAGDEKKGLEVLSHVDEPSLEEVQSFLKKVKPAIKTMDSELPLDLRVTLTHGDDVVSARIIHNHTRIVLIKHNDKIIFDDIYANETGQDNFDYGLLNMKDIVQFALKGDLSELEEILTTQIAYSTAIAQEGLQNDYGAKIGQTIIKAYGSDLHNRAKAKAAAGSDARMGGCELPVIINSGSGNQGLTVSLPVIEYAEELMISKNTLYRALTLSNLIAIYQKSQIGSLSAFCGAVSAGAAAGAAITYLRGGQYENIARTYINALAITSGILCDGAKASCAAKIAISVDAGILASDMHRGGNDFYAGDGIIAHDVDQTIHNIGQLARKGMKETDKEILYLMTCLE